MRSKKIVQPILVLVLSASCSFSTRSNHSGTESPTPQVVGTQIRFQDQYPTVYGISETPELTATSLPNTNPLYSTDADVVHVMQGWFSQSNPHILFVSDSIGSTGINTFTLINIETDEDICFETTRPIGSPIWAEDEEGAFLQLNSPSLRVYLSSGEIIRSPLTSGQFVTTNTDHQLVRMQYDGETGSVILYGTNGQRIMELDDPLGGIYPDRVRVLWNASDDLIAATRYRSPSATMYTDKKNSSITIYIRDEEPMLLFDDAWALAWSPIDPSLLLYGRGERNAFVDPCILDVYNATSTCSSVFRTWQDQTGRTTALYRWRPDGRAITFIYEDFNPQSETREVGICELDLNTELINCPITNEALPEDYSIHYYQYSCDGEYLWLLLDWTFLGGDFFPDPIVVTVRSDGSDLKIWDGFGPSWSPFICE